MFIYYTVCYFTAIFYAVARQISMLFIENKISVFCITNCVRNATNIRSVFQVRHTLNKTIHITVTQERAQQSLQVEPGVCIKPVLNWASICSRTYLGVFVELRRSYIRAPKSFARNVVGTFAQFDEHCL